MSVRHIPCGTFVNESERIAVERLKAKLQPADGHWVLLSNLNHSQHPRYRSDEIDIVAIGSNGVYVIEVKHWDNAYIRRNPQIAECRPRLFRPKSRIFLDTLTAGAGSRPLRIDVRAVKTARNAPILQK